MSKIEWTDSTISVVVVRGEDGKPNGWYCERVSPGCQHCYAERLNGTPFYGGNGLPYRQSRDGRPDLMLRRDVMARWQRARKPRRLFLNSMTDTFGEFVPKFWIYEIFDAMTAAPLITFQVLTKRANRMYNVVTEWLFDRKLSRVPVNIWLGFSAENQEWFDKRVGWVVGLPAVTFVSAEPLIGPIDVTEYMNWVIIGGESGPGARPFNVEWARDIIDQCRDSGMAPFVKQLGARPYNVLWGDIPHYWQLKDKKGGDMDEWPGDLRVREFPAVEVANA